MIFTGNQLAVHREFYTQTGAFGFGLGCNVDNTTGVYRFGVSGAQGALEFRLQSGRMYYRDQFIHAYESNTSFLLEAQFTSGQANVVKDGAPLIYGDPKATGQFNTFYFTRENAGMAATFDLNISGSNIPTYTITPNGYLTATGQSSVTGYFVNTSAYPIRVFDSQMQASQNYQFGKLVGTISGGATGTFAFTGDWATFDTSDPILTTFNENFGDTTILFNILNVASYNRFVQFTGPTDFSFNSSGVLNRTLSYLNYSGGFAGATFPANLTFSLAYVSGSGAFIDPTGAPYTKTFTGSWDFLTGVNGTSLISLNNGASSTMMSGSGAFAANSQMVFQVTHNIIDANQDSALLIISGAEVLNPLVQVLTN